jgi:hypothetical protein
LMVDGRSWEAVGAAGGCWVGVVFVDG